MLFTVQPTDMNMNIMELVSLPTNLAPEGTIEFAAVWPCASCQCFILNDFELPEKKVMMKKPCYLEALTLKTTVD